MRVSPGPLQRVEKLSLSQSIAVASGYDFRDAPANENASKLRKAEQTER